VTLVRAEVISALIFILGRIETKPMDEGDEGWSLVMGDGNRKWFSFLFRFLSMGSCFGFLILILESFSRRGCIHPGGSL